MWPAMKIAAKRPKPKPSAITSRLAKGFGSVPFGLLNALVDNTDIKPMRKNTKVPIASAATLRVCICCIPLSLVRWAAIPGRLAALGPHSQRTGYGGPGLRVARLHHSTAVAAVGHRQRPAGSQHPLTSACWIGPCVLVEHVSISRQQ